MKNLRDLIEEKEDSIIEENTVLNEAISEVDLNKLRINNLPFKLLTERQPPMVCYFSIHFQP